MSPATGKRHADRHDVPEDPAGGRERRETAPDLPPKPPATDSGRRTGAIGDVNTPGDTELSCRSRVALRLALRRRRHFTASEFFTVNFYACPLESDVLVVDGRILSLTPPPLPLPTVFLHLLPVIARIWCRTTYDVGWSTFIRRR